MRPPGWRAGSLHQGTAGSDAVEMAYPDLPDFTAQRVANCQENVKKARRGLNLRRGCQDSVRPLNACPQAKVTFSNDAVQWPKEGGQCLLVLIRQSQRADVGVSIRVRSAATII